VAVDGRNAAADARREPADARRAATATRNERINQQIRDDLLERRDMERWRIRAGEWHYWRADSHTPIIKDSLDEAMRNRYASGHRDAQREEAVVEEWERAEKNWLDMREKAGDWRSAGSGSGSALVLDVTGYVDYNKTNRAWIETELRLGLRRQRHDPRRQQGRVLDTREIYNSRIKLLERHTPETNPELLKQAEEWWTKGKIHPDLHAHIVGESMAHLREHAGLVSAQAAPAAGSEVV